MFSMILKAFMLVDLQQTFILLSIVLNFLCICEAVLYFVFILISGLKNCKNVDPGLLRDGLACWIKLECMGS